MATGTIWTDNGNKLAINRIFKASPDYTAPSQFKVGTGTTTPASTDTDLVTAVSIDGDNFKGFITGYPIVDETNLQSTIRCLLLSTEANGNSLTEFGIVNSDGTPVMVSRTVTNAISKTTSIQVTYVEKDQLL